MFPGKGNFHIQVRAKEHKVLKLTNPKTQYFKRQKLDSSQHFFNLLFVFFIGIFNLLIFLVLSAHLLLTNRS
jgi:hypothetical protein